MSNVINYQMTMPGGINFFDVNSTYFGANLTAYVQNGTIPGSRVDDMGMSTSDFRYCQWTFPDAHTHHSIATRILASWYLLHQDSPSYPPVSFSFFDIDSDEYNAHIDVQDSHYKLVRELGAASTILLKNENSVLPLGKHGSKAAERSLVLIGSDAGPGRMGPNEFDHQHGVITGTVAMGWGAGTANFTYLINVSDVRLKPGS